MTHNYQNTLLTLVRFLLYTLLILGGLSLLPHLIVDGDYSLFRENGLVELLQLLLIAAASLVFAVGSWKEPQMRILFTQFSLFSAIAAMREMDGFFDKIPYICWQMPAGAILVLAVWLMCKNWKLLLPQLERFIASAPFGILWASVIIITLIAQLVGNGHFLQLLMGDDYLRDYKRVIEEITELFGYIIFLQGALETVLFGAKFHCAQSVHLAVAVGPAAMEINEI